MAAAATPQLGYAASVNQVVDAANWLSREMEIAKNKIAVLEAGNAHGIGGGGNQKTPSSRF